jgi:hypothetical protein
MDSCLNCVRKHLCQAMIVHEEEVPLGYEEHIDRVIGHLGEASREALGSSPSVSTAPKYKDLAEVLREYRLKVMDNPNYLPPYKDLLSYVRVLIHCSSEGLVAIPAVPKDCDPREPVLLDLPVVIKPDLERMGKDMVDAITGGIRNLPPLPTSS